jgi:hypothetical protein
MAGVSDLKSESYSFSVYADTPQLVESTKAELVTALNAINRQDVGGLHLIIAIDNGQSDNIEERNNGNQVPAFSEIITYIIWFR